MRISYNWLKDYIDLDFGTEELKRILTFSGIEVEAVEELPALPDSVVSAYIVSAQKIEGSDHLQVCQVDYGQGHCQVVCGAANCHSGMKAVLALPGSKLGDLTIKEARLRGVLSSGMLCSERELGISDNHDGIIELPPDTPVGSSVNSLYALPDTIFELEITPNRSDLLGYLGIAKDLSASTNKPVKIPQPCLTEEEEPIFRHLSVKVTDSRFCPRYTARLFQDVKIGESPLWLKVKLLKSGLRPINNAVDITNFVMLEAGHPLHAFDYQCVGDRQIIIRPAASQEQISTLDGKTYALDERDLVIADSKHPIAIAGVIGGTNSHITDATKEIVLEAATFNAGLVRKTSYTHKIQTDSAYRFERHLCPEAVVYASNRAAELFTSLCQARLCTGVLDDWQHPEKPVVLGIRPSRFTKLIGYRLSDEKIQQYLSSLGLRFIQYGTWIPGKIENLEQIYCYHTEQMKQGVTEFDEDVNCIHSQYYEIPPNRVDLEREIDLIEELARLHGYDKVPRKLSPQIIMDRHAHKTRRMLADLMVENGFFEIVNYSFDDPDDAQLLGFQNGFKLINPQSSQLSAMRQTLIPQVLKTALYNLNHDERNIKLFEMNKVFISQNADSYLEPYRLTAILTGKADNEHWQQKNADAGFFHVKGVVETILSKLELTDMSTSSSGREYLIPAKNLQYRTGDRELACFGCLNPEFCEKFGIDLIELKQEIWLIDLDVDLYVELGRNQSIVFEPLSKFPSVFRDISFLISDDVDFERIRQSILCCDTKLIKDVSIFDEYRGKQVPEGCRSISLHLRLCDEEKTLTIQRVDEVLDQVLKLLQDTWQVKQR